MLLVINEKLLFVKRLKDLLISGSEVFICLKVQTENSFWLFWNS